MNCWIAIRYDNPDWLALSLYTPTGVRLYPLDDPPGFGGLYPLHHIVVPVGFLKPAVGELRLTVDMSSGIAAAEQLGSYLLLALLPLLLLLLVVIWLEVELSIRRPLGQMLEATRWLMRGRYDAGLPPDKPDEIGELTRTFAEMRDVLQRHHIDMAEELEQERQRALSLEREKRRAEYEAMHDPLTGLLNRRELERRMQLLQQRFSHDLSRSHVLLFIDLDHFKAVNDSCGHQAGDELLREIVQVMRRRIREKDIFARLGGDEFAILLKDCEQRVGVRIANDICRAVLHYRFPCEGQLFQVGASIGVALMDAAQADMEQLIAAADAACYEAKRKGRGRVELAVESGRPGAAAEDRTSI